MTSGKKSPRHRHQRLPVRKKKGLLIINLPKVCSLKLWNRSFSLTLSPFLAHALSHFLPLLALAHAHHLSFPAKFNTSVLQTNQKVSSIFLRESQIKLEFKMAACCILMEPFIFKLDFFSSARLCPLRY